MKRKEKSMKRIIMTALMAVTFMSAMADTEKEMSKEELASAYDMSISYRSLDRALELTQDQADYMHMAYDLFQKQMECAGMCSGKASRDAMTSNALRSHVGIIRPVLDQRQYRKYLTLLNTTLRNRNIDTAGNNDRE